MTLLLDERGDEIPEAELPSSAACPKCGQDKRQTVRSFGHYWKVLCGNCGHQFDSGKGVPPMEDE
jgi:rubredoxin